MRVAPPLSLRLLSFQLTATRAPARPARSPPPGRPRPSGRCGRRRPGRSRGRRWPGKEKEKKGRGRESSAAKGPRNRARTEGWGHARAWRSARWRADLFLMSGPGRGRGMGRVLRVPAGAEPEAAGGAVLAFARKTRPAERDCAGPPAHPSSPSSASLARPASEAGPDRPPAGVAWAARRGEAGPAGSRPRSSRALLFPQLTRSPHRRFRQYRPSVGTQAAMVTRAATSHRKTPVLELTRPGGSSTMSKRSSGAALILLSLGGAGAGRAQLGRKFNGPGRRGCRGGAYVGGGASRAGTAVRALYSPSLVVEKRRLKK